jgi:hypothetical protein
VFFLLIFLSSYSLYDIFNSILKILEDLLELLNEIRDNRGNLENSDIPRGDMYPSSDAWSNETLVGELPRSSTTPKVKSPPPSGSISKSPTSPLESLEINMV